MSFVPESSRPLPELLGEGDWEVRNSGELKKAYVDFKKREFVVPFIPGPAGELIRAHEAMHVKISPRKHNYVGADFVTFQSLEDARVHQALRITGIPTDKGRVFSHAEMAKALMGQTPLRHAEAYFATKGLAEEENLRTLIEKSHADVLPICDDIYEKYFSANEREHSLTSNDQRDKAVVELKERIEEISSEEEKRQDRGQRGTDASKKRKNITASWEPGSSDMTEQTELPIITPEEGKEIKNALPAAYVDYSEAYGNEPGEMTIHTPKLPHVIKFKKVKGVKTTPNDEGVIPMHMHRWATDQKVFTRKGKRRTNAAVLIDISGSMSLNVEQIEKIIRLSPASIVAVYAGRGNYGGLNIVAEKGRWTDEFFAEHMGGSNVVDIPALQWLAKRPEKTKLWISDGFITGKGDGALKPIYVRKIMHIIKDAKIQRVGNVKGLLDSNVLIDRAFDDGHEIGARMKVRTT